MPQSGEKFAFTTLLQRRALQVCNVTGGSLLAGLTPTGQCRSGLMLDGFTRNPVARKPEGGI